ncbi:MAG: hypothetical protein J0M11_21110 [Anaerolineae bacterium]|jgi:hypothetical protein|nr:hypothetical protein [Anaerolineae bacterium]
MRQLFFDEVQKNEILKREFKESRFPLEYLIELEVGKNLFFSTPEDIVRFDVSNVSDMVSNHVEKTRRIPKKREVINSIPNIAPPFPRMWLEFSYTKKHEKDSSLFMSNQMKRRLPKNVFDALISQVEKVPNGLIFAVREGVYLESQRTTRGWNICGVGFSDVDGNLIPYGFSLSAALDGSPPSDGGFSAFSFKQPVDDSFYAHISSSVYTFFYAIALAHCKNIITEEVGGKSETIKNRRHRNKGTRHHVLKIIPMKKVKAYQEKGASSLSKGDTSLHIRRGHFKTYSPEAPLFGVHSGTYWWEAHTAGKAEVGTVTKDYQVNTPGE